MKNRAAIVFLLFVFGALSVYSFSPENDFSSFSEASTADSSAVIKGIVQAATGGAASQTTILSNAKLTLTNRAVPDFLLTTVSGEDGRFIFNSLPAGKYTLTAEAVGLPTVAREITLAAGATLMVEINLTVEVAETVVVRDEEGLLSTSETTTSNIVRAETLQSQPFRTDNYQSALPLTPGVVNDSKGSSYVKGTRAGQSGYTVNGVDVTDPVTGESSFNLPLEAASSVEIEENPYSAEFGNFTGGVTNLQTKGGGEKFKISAARFFPTFHNVFSTKVDSFRPRLTLSGPLIKNRLSFLQSFEYRFTRSFVPSQPKPLDSTALEGFYGFTQLDLTINKNNVLKFNFALFPQKFRFFGLDTFNPAATTPNVKQRGYLVSASEQSIFKNTSFLSSTVSYKSSDADVFAQGSQPLTIAPESNRGNYFADTRRRTNRLQIQETYYFKPFDFRGQHALKAGLDYNHANVSGRFRYNSIFLRRRDDTLAQRIDFTKTEYFSYGYNEVGAFVQDRWILNPKLTLDFGLRLDRDGVSEANNVAPRFSFLYSPFKDSRTVIRGGIGLFYDRTLPSAGYFNDRFEEDFDDDSSNNSDGRGSRFDNVPERTVTNFAADGRTVAGSPVMFRNTISADINSPRSVRWNLQIDRGITKNLTARIGYLQRKTRNELLVEPILTGFNSGQIVLSSDGRSRYRELQFLVNYNKPRFGQWNVSYVLSKATGDLNTADKFLGDFPAFVVRPNESTRLSFDAPHRFLLYGQIDLPHDIRVAPLFEMRSGFPFSAVNEKLEFVGARNQAGRFPNYLSLDLQITKGITIPFFDKKRARIGVALFNLTNHFNPRDIQNNLASPNFGKFYNSLGTSVKAKIDLDL